MKRTLTAEQAKAAAERKGKFRELCARIKSLGPNQRAELSARMPAVTVEGHTLSACNQLLIALQLPAATILGGFRQWIAHGRAVSKGQHGACIWVPTHHAHGDTSAQDGDAETAERCGFVMGTVFDVTQTEEIGAAPAAVRCTRCGYTADISTGATIDAKAWSCPHCTPAAAEVVP